MPWSGQQLFGMVDQLGEPAPLLVRARENNGGSMVVFAFRTTDGLYREIWLPFDHSQPVLRCSLQLDLATATVTAWVDHVQVEPDLTMINDRWLPEDRAEGEVLAFVSNWYSPLNLGSLTPNGRGWGGIGLAPGRPG